MVFSFLEDMDLADIVAEVDIVADTEVGTECFVGASEEALVEVLQVVTEGGFDCYSY